MLAFALSTSTALLFYFLEEKTHAETSIAFKRMNCPKKCYYNNAQKKLFRTTNFMTNCCDFLIS